MKHFLYALLLLAPLSYGRAQTLDSTATELQLQLNNLESLINIFAQKITINAKCPLKVINANVAPNPPPKYSFGSGTAKTKDLACKAAKKNANDKVPKGMQAVHCRCL